MNRGTTTFSAAGSQRVPVTRGNALLVQVDPTGYTGTIDLQSSVDGATWTNHPYVQQNVLTPARSVSQISSPSSRTLYLMLPPLVDVKIIVACSAGSVVVTWREVKDPGDLPA